MMLTKARTWWIDDDKSHVNTCSHCSVEDDIKGGLVFPSLAPNSFDQHLAGLRWGSGYTDGQVQGLCSSFIWCSMFTETNLPLKGERACKNINLSQFNYTLSRLLTTLLFHSQSCPFPAFILFDQGRSTRAHTHIHAGTLVSKRSWHFQDNTIQQTVNKGVFLTLLA